MSRHLSQVGKLRPRILPTWIGAPQSQPRQGLLTSTWNTYTWEMQIAPHQLAPTLASVSRPPVDGLPVCLPGSLSPFTPLWLAGSHSRPGGLTSRVRSSGHGSRIKDSGEASALEGPSHPRAA